MLTGIPLQWEEPYGDFLKSATNRVRCAIWTISKLEKQNA